VEARPQAGTGAKLRYADILQKMAEWHVGHSILE
jgi:hypothetical protein